MPDDGRDPPRMPAGVERVVGRAGLDPVGQQRRQTIDRLRFQAEQELRSVQDQLVIQRAVLRELELQERDLLRLIQAAPDA